MKLCFQLVDPSIDNEYTGCSCFTDVQTTEPHPYENSDTGCSTVIGSYIIFCISFEA
jgi:hypothetical protein